MIIVLVGMPGSGKTTWRKHIMEIDPNISYVSQDEFKNREKCIDKANELLTAKKDVIIDRCNIDKGQRSYWLDLAKKYEVKVECVYFDINPEICLDRINRRVNHETITSDMSLDKKRSIINKFVKSKEEPTLEEGFSIITVIKYN